MNYRLDFTIELKFEIFSYYIVFEEKMSKLWLFYQQELVKKVPDAIFVDEVWPYCNQWNFALKIRKNAIYYSFNTCRTNPIKSNVNKFQRIIQPQSFTKSSSTFYLNDVFEQI